MISRADILEVRDFVGVLFFLNSVKILVQDRTNVAGKENPFNIYLNPEKETILKFYLELKFY